MYLKSIEVHGFKSFANKIHFDFHNGITGIVGPNGSGKSNVADAVRWVLGEQRAKQLRGASMQDVIFAGTENRKPLSYASVSITLDNSDGQLPVEYTEVTVTRRVYRSGESEYLLNGTPCRLKDVNELFYDTGIGKEGYSIIGQGQIDKILSGRPEERRELFDEAAGIVKYKRRKQTAEKKLENEQANLLRVNDILGELEKQTGPLEKQSEAAKVFLKKKEELKVLDVNLFLREMDRLEEQLEQIQEKGKITNQDLEQTNLDIESIKQEYEKMEQEIAKLDEQVEKTKNQMNETTLTKGKLEGQINVLKEQIKSANQNDDHYQQRRESLHNDALSKEEQKKTYEKEYSELEMQLKMIRDKLNQERASLKSMQSEISECNEGIEKGKNELIDILNAKASTKAKKQKFETMMEQVNIRKAQLNQRLLQKKSDEVQMQESLTHFQEEVNRFQNLLEEKTQEKKKLEQKQQEWSFKLKDASRKLEEKSNAFHKIESQLESLQNIAERYEGYGNSIKKVMENKDQEKGLIGVVADIIQVEKKYETAIETALGGNVQNIVTQDEETAKKMVQFLKERKYGRATFLPLTSVTPQEDEKLDKILNEKGVLGRADKLVQTEDRFQKVISYLLCRVLVVDEIDHALQLAKKYKYSLRIVTLDGEALNPGGSLSGGSFRNSSNLLGRTRELEELEKKKKELSEEKTEIQNRIEEIKTAQELLLDDQKETEQNLQSVQIDLRSAILGKENAQKQKDESDTLYQGLQLENQQIETQLAEIKENQKQIESMISESVARQSEIEQETTVYQEKLEKGLFLEENQSKLVSEIQIEEANLAQKQEFSRENLERINGEILRLEQEGMRIEESCKQSKEEVEQKNKEIEMILGTMDAGTTAYQELAVSLEQLQKEKENVTQSHKGFFDKREELTKRQSNLDKEIFRLNSQREKMEESIENHKNYMWNEYELTLHHALELRLEDMDNISLMKKQIGELHDAIRKLGDVNVNAIEDYKNLMERYTFLKNQHDDLVEAEKSLESIIEDLDSGMRKQFREKFEEIQKEFNQVFRELFGGGKGTLELAEGEDILECGILIIAQPPGKKLQNMMQLSGGEKALTAIALLFAIQNMKPSPFCLLDEIEAALDDSNVNRFAKYLGKLTKHTQFIIITHRRGTMAVADRLYGITMQEKGVSALVSVNLIENDLEK